MAGEGGQGLTSSGVDQAANITSVRTPALSLPAGRGKFCPLGVASFQGAVFTAARITATILVLRQVEMPLTDPFDICRELSPFFGLLRYFGGGRAYCETTSVGRFG